jgi:NADP-dependent 3-hydroxy acid dehydrogenase YdfG
MRQKGINSFSGKHVWIVGASSGIGEACAKSLIEQGARVPLSTRRVERLNAIAEVAKVDRALVIPIDVTY